MPQKKLQKQKQQNAPIEINNSYMNVGSGMLINAPDLDGRLDYPIMKKANRIPLITQLEKPNEEMVIQAHEDVGLKLSSGSIMHPKRVSRALEKYNNQKRLLRLSDRKYEVEEAQKDEMVNTLANVELSSFLYGDTNKSADDALLDNYSELKNHFAYIKAYEEDINTNKPADKNTELRHKARIMTLKDIRTYYEIIEALMLNKYYARLPRAEMLKLSETTLMVRLNKLYEKPEGKAQLIDFYQNLLRLKRLGIHSEKDVKEREEAYFKELKGEDFVDTRNADEEAKKLVASYDSLVKNLKSKGSLLSADDRRKRRLQFLEVCGGDIHNYRNSIIAIGSEASRKLISAYDAFVPEGLEEFENNHADRSVEKVLKKNEDAKLLERRRSTPKGIKLSEPQKDAMKVIQTFLMRRSSQDPDKAQSFVYNFLQAPPEQQLTAFYLIESGRQSKGLGADFYTALHGYIPDLSAFRKKVNKHFWGGTRWDVIADAVQASKGLGEDMKEYASLSVRTEDAETAFEKASEDPEKFMDQGRSAVEAISLHVASLRQLYALSGMNENMPPDLAEDRKLREKMYNEYKRIGELAGALGKLINDHPEITARINEQGNAGTKSVIAENDEKGAIGKSVDFGSKISKKIGYLKSTDGVVANMAVELEEAAKVFTEENFYYKFSKGSVLGLGYVLALADSIYGIFQLAGKESASLAEGIANWTGKVNGVIGNLSWTGSEVLGLLKTAGTVEKKAGEVVTAGNVLSGVCVATGLVSMAVESVQLGRAIDNGKDLETARNKFKSRTRNKAFTGKEKRFARYLKHQDREIGRQKVGAGVKLITSTASTATTYMAMTGVLAPLAGALTIVNGVASLTFNLFYDKMWRKDNIAATVDEYLGVNKIAEEMKNNPNMNIEGNVSDSVLIKHARREALGRLGYTSYKQCYREICRQFAELLYTKLFCKQSSDRDEWDMYNSALGALGFKKAAYREDYGDNPKPTMKAILAKVMG